MSENSSVETPAELAGGAFESTVRAKASELKRELIKQTMEDIESWSKAVEVQWQQAHPNGGVQSPITEAEYQKYVGTVQNEYYEWVEPAFERRLTPDPDAINSMIAALRTIESSFQGSQDNAGNFSPASPALSRINDVRTDMGHWQGDLQSNFIDNFLTPLQTVSINQASVAKVVREQLECNKVMYIRYRKGILNLLNQSIEAVKVLNNQRDPKSYTWGTLVGISVGTALTLCSGGLAVAGAVVIIGSTLAQGLVPDPPKTFELGAPTAQEVAVNIAGALSKMDNDISLEEKKVEDSLRNIHTTIAGARSSAINGNTAGPLSVAVPDVVT
ncbi:MAG: hypothetical protein JXA67_02335, partial [Micromonosporaceae bacterium]|nr:hypothetical protein [Micromonosporaceae bacterium]